MSIRSSDTIELGHVVRTIVRGWRWVVGFVVLGVVAAWAIVAFAPRKFKGVTTVVVRTSGSSSGGSSVLSQISGLGDLTAGLLSGKSPIETEIEVMSSRAVVGMVVDSLDLAAKITAPTPVPARDLLANLDAPGAFSPAKYVFDRDGASGYRFSGDSAGTMSPGTPLRLRGATLTFAPTAKLPSHFTLLLRDHEDAIDWVSRHLKVAKEKGEVASITYRGDDSLTAARLPNLLLDLYLARRRGVDRGINQRRVEFLTAQSDSMSRALSLAANALRRQQERTGIVDPKVVARVDIESGADQRAKLTDVLVQQGALRRLMDGIEAKTLTTRELAAFPQFIGSNQINNLVSQLGEFDTRITEALATKAPDNPEVVAMRKAAADIEARILPYARTYAAALEQQRAELQTSIDKIDRSLTAVPGAAEASTRLEDEVVGLTKLLGGIQGQIVEARLAAIGEGGDVRLLDPAFVSKKPSFPDPIIALPIGLAVGLLSGLITALLAGSVGRWTRDPAEVERTTGIPALQFDPSIPLLLSEGPSRTIIVAPIESGASVTAVVNRLAQTATSRSASAAVLTLPQNAADVNGSISRLESQHDMVIVELSSLVSDTAAAALQHTRPVLLVASGHRVDRRRLLNAVQMLRRLEVPVAGIVMSNGSANGHLLPR